MDTPPIRIDPTGGRPWAALQTAIDVSVSTLVGSIIAILIIVGSTFLFQAACAAPPWQTALAAMFLVWCAITESWFLIATWRIILNKDGPFAVAVAMQHPMLPRLLRPVAALWWGYQCLMALAWGMVLVLSERQLPIAAAGVVAMITSAFSYFTFGYFLLAATAFTKESNTINMLWDWRGRWAAAQGVSVFIVKLLANLF